MADACTSVDTDLLGLGVRLGVYLQLLAYTILSATGGQTSMLGHAEAASATLASILVVLLVRIGQGNIHTAECLCVLMLALSQSLIVASSVLWVKPMRESKLKVPLRPEAGSQVEWPWLDSDASRGTLNFWRSATACLRQRIDGERLIEGYDASNEWHILEAMQLDLAERSHDRRERSITLQLAIIVAFWVINTWFWQAGYAGLHREGCGPVLTPLFVFRVRAFGWFRYLALCVCYSGTFLSMMMLVHRIHIGLFHAPRQLRPSAMKDTAPHSEYSIGMKFVAKDFERLRFSSLYNPYSLKRACRCDDFITLAVLWWVVVVQFEVSLKMNHLNSGQVGGAGLGGTGQLLSLVVGVALVLSSLLAPVEPWDEHCTIESCGFSNSSCTKVKALLSELKVLADEGLAAIQREDAVESTTQGDAHNSHEHSNSALQVGE